MNWVYLYIYYYVMYWTVFVVSVILLSLLVVSRFEHYICVSVCEFLCLYDDRVLVMVVLVAVIRICLCWLERVLLGASPPVRPCVSLFARFSQCEISHSQCVCVCLCERARHSHTTESSGSGGGSASTIAQNDNTRNCIETKANENTHTPLASERAGDRPNESAFSDFAALPR